MKESENATTKIVDNKLMCCVHIVFLQNYTIVLTFSLKDGAVLNSPNPRHIVFENDHGVKRISVWRQED